MSASVRCVFVATSRRAFPTLTVSHRNSGISSSDRIVSGTEIRTIAIDRADDRDDVGEHRGRGVGDDGLNPAHVVREPRLDLTGPGRREEAERHRLEMLVQPVPEVLHHVQAHQVRVVGLAHPDDARHDRDRDHDADVEIEQRKVRARLSRTHAVGTEQRLVEDQDDHQRVDHAEAGGDADHQPDQPDLALVRLERADHAADRRAVDGAMIFVDRRDAEEAVPAHQASIRAAADKARRRSSARDYSAKQGPKISALVTSSPGSDQ